VKPHFRQYKKQYNKYKRPTVKLDISMFYKYYSKSAGTRDKEFTAKAEL